MTSGYGIVGDLFYPNNQKRVKITWFNTPRALNRLSSIREQAMK